MGYLIVLVVLYAINTILTVVALYKVNIVIFAWAEIAYTAYGITMAATVFSGDFLLMAIAAVFFIIQTIACRLPIYIRTYNEAKRKYIKEHMK